MKLGTAAILGLVAGMGFFPPPVESKPHEFGDAYKKMQEEKKARAAAARERKRLRRMGK